MHSVIKDGYLWKVKILSVEIVKWQNYNDIIYNIRQIRQALNIGGVATEVSAWFDKSDKGGSRDVDNIVGGHQKAVHNSQIDLIIEQSDCLNLCEDFVK